MLGLRWRFLLGKPVPNKLSSNVLILETRIASPFKVTPLPRSAAKSSFRVGSYTTPAITSLLRASPSETQKTGKPCAKFVVPSRGSTYQRHSPELWEREPSSPTIP